jgi:hypothetical protein
MTSTTGNVVATLFVDKQVSPIDGWNGGTGVIFTKVFSDNVNSMVQFVDILGNTGSTGILVDRIEYPDSNYGYNGDYQTFIAPQNGKYQIELWGAGAFDGGKGAYTKGTLALRAGDMLYLYVGQNAGYTANGVAFNGGQSNSDGRPGGGASDVRLLSGTRNTATGLNSRIMVAAGGGAYSKNT